VNTRRLDQPVKFWRKRVVVVGAGATLVLVVAFGLLLWLARPLLAGPKLTTLTLSGRLQHVDPAAVRNAVRPELGSGFFNTRVERIVAAVDALPWVAEADVRREWPHTLRVDIVEEVAVARWGSDGLMDAQGKVFVHAVDKAYASLPQLSGRDDAAADVGGARRWHRSAAGP
jgi:cell division protein FtsQ